MALDQQRPIANPVAVLREEFDDWGLRQSGQFLHNLSWGYESSLTTETMT